MFDPKSSMNWVISAAVATVLLSPSPALANAVVRSITGASPSELQPAIDQFQGDLGGVDHGEEMGPFTDGYRRLNWDSVPDGLASPNLLPPDFYMTRGVYFDAAGNDLLASADAANPSMTPVLFGDIDPSYSALFQPFSSERVFAVREGTSVDVSFYLPSDPATRAWVQGIGMVFSSVDSSFSTSIELFDPDGFSLGEYFVPAGPQGGLSFLGVSFDANEQVGSVRIHSGNAPLGPGILDGGLVDLVVMDDFFFGEPRAVPEPAVLAVGLLGLIGLAVRGRR